MYTEQKNEGQAWELGSIVKENDIWNKNGICNLVPDGHMRVAVK